MNDTNTKNNEDIQNLRLLGKEVIKKKVNLLFKDNFFLNYLVI